MVTPRLVVLLCGPPGAGKTTLAHQAPASLTVYDRDDPQWAKESDFRQALREIADEPRAQAVVIRAGASSSARRKAADLVNATHVYLVIADRATLRQRVSQRARGDLSHGLAAVDTWFAQHDRLDRVQPFPGWAAVLADTLTPEQMLGNTRRQW